MGRVAIEEYNLSWECLKDLSANLNGAFALLDIHDEKIVEGSASETVSGSITKISYDQWIEK